MNAVERINAPECGAAAEVQGRLFALAQRTEQAAIRAAGNPDGEGRRQHVAAIVSDALVEFDILAREVAGSTYGPANPGRAASTAQQRLPRQQRQALADRLAAVLEATVRDVRERIARLGKNTGEPAG